MSDNVSTPDLIAQQVAAVSATLSELHDDTDAWLRETRRVRREFLLRRLLDTALEWLAACAMCVAGIHVLVWATRPADPILIEQPFDALERTAALLSGLAGVAAPAVLLVIRLAGYCGWKLTRYPGLGFFTRD